MTSETDPEFARIAQALLDLVTRVPAFFTDFAERADDQSQFLMDLRSYPRREVIHNLLSQGNLVLASATEHVGATAVLIQNRAYAMALWTCARTATESSALGAWLYDPTVDITERVSRSFAYRHEGLEQQRRLFNAGSGDTEAQAVTAQIDRVEREALDLGFAPVIDRNGRRIGIGQRMPEATTLVENMFRAGGLYRLLSQAAHGNISALRQLNYNPAVVSALVDDGRGNFEVLLLERGPQLEAIKLVAHHIVNVYARAQWLRAVLFGYDRQILAGIYERVYGDLAIAPNDRFWVARRLGSERNGTSLK